ncbi:MAG TPA: DUF2334 domain-containing protein [Solirubrobacterales bacterium]|nr:DUF2334 domain-containing protein [Solirubrobacterales bacterium]
MSASERRRSAALMAWPQPVPAERMGSAAVLEPFGGPARPSLPRRLAQAVALKRGRLSWRADVAEPLARAREAALGAAAAAPPRALVRVDEFPHARAFDSTGRFGTEAYRRFHAVLAEAGVPYLVAVPPRVSRDYLDPAVTESRGLDEGELGLLAELREDEKVTFALHGLDHRTRHASPRRHSEFLGLSPAAAAARVDDARSRLAELGLETPVFVAPFNRFDRAQYDILAERFEVICGGPESIRLLGFTPTPVWRGKAVYLPSYAPLYSRAANVAAELRRLEQAGAAGIWAPVTLHWGWELDDDFAALRDLCGVLARQAADWRDLLAAVAASRDAGEV